MQVQLRWVITEEHQKIIEVDNDFDPDSEDDLDSLLAEIEDNDSWVATTDRQLTEWEKVE